jgi:hypothetical protein
MSCTRAEALATLKGSVWEVSPVRSLTACSHHNFIALLEARQGLIVVGFIARRLRRLATHGPFSHKPVFQHFCRRADTRSLSHVLSG